MPTIFLHSTKSLLSTSLSPSLSPSPLPPSPVFSLSSSTTFPLPLLCVNLVRFSCLKHLNPKP